MHPFTDISDWLTYERYIYKIESMLFKIRQLLVRLSCLVYPENIVLLKNNYIKYSEKMMSIGIQQFSRYSFVISTRLHGHILASIMMIDNKVIDNSYGKNSAFVEMWTKNLRTTK